MSDLAPENIYKNVKKAAGYGPDEKIARAAMQEGKALFRDKKYKEAAAKFATAADRWPDSPLEEDALFLQGRERVLLRPVSEGPRHLRRSAEEVHEHAASRHGGRPRVRHRPLLGAVARRQAARGRSRRT